MSSAVTPFSPPELHELLDKSRRNNSALGVTGLLVYKDGNFLQVLEGERARVDDLYAKISLDPRHHGVKVFIQEEIPEREFGEWSMGFRDLNTNPQETPSGFNDLLNQNWYETDLSVFSRKVQPFLKMFAK